MRKPALYAFLAGALLAAAARAELPPDIGRGPTSASLTVPASKHWVWVNDFVFPHMADGMAYLIDGDSGRYLGTLSTGYSFTRVIPSRDGKLIYSPETYFARGTRGKRTDVITLYDPGTLNAVGEIAIPPKRSSNMPMIANQVLTDDDRFLLIYNFNPAQSVTVVDTGLRKFVREIETPGCALIYPTGPRSFFSVCGDGSLSLVELDDNGAAQGRRRTQPFFDMAADPVTEKAVRIGNVWYFVSFAGRIHSLEVGPQQATAGPTWWLTSEAERKDGWLPGGIQQLAVNSQKSRLYSIMHRGGIETHKDPGKDVWVFDVSTRQRVQKVALKNLASSIQLSSDAQLLFSIFIDSPTLDIYDAANGMLLRSVEHVGTTPTIMVSP
jgi:methylamine dehydrogenase heavy chain